MLPDLLLDGGATAKTLSILMDEDTIGELRKLLTGHHSEVLDQKVTPVGHGDFGASAPGASLGADADLAHQHVVAVLKEMAEGLAGFASALDKASAHLADVDEDSAVTTTQIDSSLDRVDTTFDGADTHGTTVSQSTVGGQQPTTTAPASTGGSTATSGGPMGGAQ
ncbi:hypothetical protein [Nocardioides sp. Iso805N]|uniref:hypothetical protein n=1 Tax=Nocardioides sp. Iso805N TaxID=1283287 RepID=UPI000560E0B3|nr:hypothetical protein [Nocardioides sp. Iso805N]